MHNNTIAIQFANVGRFGTTALEKTKGEENGKR